MAKISVIIQDSAGLHARPASNLTKVAASFASDIKIHFNGKEANAKSIMNVLALGVKKGDEITIEALGADEEEAINKIKEELIESKLIS